MKRKLIGFILLLTMGSVNAAELVKLTQKQTIPRTASLLQQPTISKLKELRKFSQHTRLQQVIDGIPVYGYHLLYHHSFKKSYYTGHWINLSPKEQKNLVSHSKHLSAHDAIIIAKQDFQIRSGAENNVHYHCRDEVAKLYYYLNDAKQLKKTYWVTFVADDVQGQQPARPYYLIDAYSNEIIKYWNGLTTSQIGTGPGGNEKTGPYRYGKDYQNLDVSVKEDGITCQMENKYVETIHLNHEVNSTNIHEFICPENNNDGINGGYSPLNDAHFFGGVIFDMYQNWYKIPPLPFKLKMQVHYGYNYENAFWDGSSMYFGDGGSKLYPLVALDVAAHEVSHGLTEKNSSLEYWGQSGGVNESFSDMAGKAAEYYLRGENKWTIGSDITKGKAPIRYMDNPDRDGNSIRDIRDFYPAMDVHLSSGIFNRLFYKLTTTDDWNTRKAFEVFLNANLHYWEPETDFLQATEGVLQATKDLNYNLEDVLNAAKSVGIDCVPSENVYECRPLPENMELRLTRKSS